MAVYVMAVLRDLMHHFTLNGFFFPGMIAIATFKQCPKYQKRKGYRWRVCYANVDEEVLLFLIVPMLFFF